MRNQEEVWPPSQASLSPFLSPASLGAKWNHSAHLAQLTAAWSFTYNAFSPACL